jgi:hypothetical protein
MALLDDRNPREKIGLSPLPDNWGSHGLDGRAIAKEVKAQTMLPGRGPGFAADATDAQRRETWQLHIKAAGLSVMARALTTRSFGSSIGI